MSSTPEAPSTHPPILAPLPRLQKAVDELYALQAGQEQINRTLQGIPFGKRFARGVFEKVIIGTQEPAPGEIDYRLLENNFAPAHKDKEKQLFSADFYRNAILNFDDLVGDVQELWEKEELSKRPVFLITPHAYSLSDLGVAIAALNKAGASTPEEAIMVLGQLLTHVNVRVGAYTYNAIDLARGLANVQIALPNTTSTVALRHDHLAAIKEYNQASESIINDFMSPDIESPFRVLATSPTATRCKKQGKDTLVMDDIAGMYSRVLEQNPEVVVVIISSTVEDITLFLSQDPRYGPFFMRTIGYDVSIIENTGRGKFGEAVRASTARATGKSVIKSATKKSTRASEGLAGSARS